jgi:hypothetical protein
VVKPRALGQETVAVARPRPYRAWCSAPSADQRAIQRPVHVDLAMGEPDTKRGRTPDSESGENAEEYIDLAISEHDAERDSKAAGAPVACVDLAKGPAESPVAFIGLALSDLEKKLEVALAKRVRGHAEDDDSW